MRPASIFAINRHDFDPSYDGIAAPRASAREKADRHRVYPFHERSHVHVWHQLRSRRPNRHGRNQRRRGVLGRPLKMITRDDKLNPEAGLREAKDLLLSEKADFLTGTISSAVALAISNHVKREKKIFIVNISQSSSITEENWHRYIFRIDTNAVPYWGYAPALALGKTWKDKKIISLGFDYEMGKNSIRQFKEKYLQLVPDAKIIDELWAPLGTTDFTAYIYQDRQLRGAMLSSWPAFMGEENWLLPNRPMPLAFTTRCMPFNPAPVMWKPGMESRKGSLIPKGPWPPADIPFGQLKTPRSKAFVEKHNKMVGFWPSYGAMNQYFIIYALKAAIEKVRAVDTEKIINALEGMTLDTFVGKVPIRAYDHQAMMPNWYGIMILSRTLRSRISPKSKSSEKKATIRWSRSRSFAEESRFLVNQQSKDAGEVAAFPGI